MLLLPLHGQLPSQGARLLLAEAATEHLPTHDGSRLPHRVLRFNSSIVCVESVRHGARIRHLLVHKAHVHKLTLCLVHLRHFIALTLGKIERDFGTHLTLLKLLLLSRHIIHHHGAVDLSLKLALHLSSSARLLGRVQYAHGLEVECAHTSHEHLLEVLLHDMLVAVHS